MSTGEGHSGLVVATGGKENDLKIWDGNRPDAPPIFKARNVIITVVVPCLVGIHLYTLLIILLLLLLL